VGRGQPSILESLKVVSVKTSPNVEGGGSVNTLTGSVSVADSQSNTVTSEAGLEYQVPGDSLKTDASLVENANLEDNVSQMRSAKTSSDKSSAHAHPISHPWESSEAFARIGLVAEGVGPKKLKTSEYQQPRPAVEPLLGVVRGVVGASKARREVGSQVKPVNVGESSVNTHTGSVSVAGSQSNTVTPEAGPGAHNVKDSLKTDAKQETSNMSSSVDKSNSMKSSENSVREEAKSTLKKEPAVSALKERKKIKIKINSKFEINTLPGGKFSLKFAKPKPTFVKFGKKSYRE
jgi:hypothetical protein